MPIEAGDAGAPRLVVRSVELGVRPIVLRLPFRFGAVTLERCPQLFVRATVEVAGAGTAVGFAAETMVPRWFDKRPERSAADNVRDLAATAERAAAAYVGGPPATAVGLFVRHHAELAQAGLAAGETPLTTAFGQAVVDRAVLDAACAALGVSFFDFVRGNGPGFADSALWPDLGGHDWAAWLSGLAPERSLEARHTIGMADALEGPHEPESADDGLPATLVAAIRRYGHRRFKIKLGGDPAADAERVAAVLAVLDREAPGHRFTLDGNEQLAGTEALAGLVDALAALPAIARRPEALLWIEQPCPRDATFARAVPPSPVPWLVDEADADFDSFPRAARLGWTGISSKSCKGIWKAIVNRARVDRWNGDAERDGLALRFVMSAEDLTCQAGLSVQQDSALAALLGLGHAERNGHHYVGGFGDAPTDEAAAFQAAHPDLYAPSDHGPRLAIRDGRLALDSLFAPGFAHRAAPDWRTMRPLADATTFL